MIPASQQAKLPTEAKRASPSFLLVKSLLATGTLLGIILVGESFYGNAGFSLSFLPGANSPKEQLVTPDAPTALQLYVVPEQEVAAAIDDMRLSPADKQALESDLKESPQAATATTRKNRLAHITLWEAGMKNGDVVRIDSQGYVRMVTLTKNPITFSIPLPADGHISITGSFAQNGQTISYGTIGWPPGSLEAKWVVQHIDQGQTLSKQVRVTP